MKDLGKFVKWFSCPRFVFLMIWSSMFCLDVPGYGKGYNMAHKDVSHLTYMPKGLENVDFFDRSESV
jgi:hypothetical protein